MRWTQFEAPTDLSASNVDVDGVPLPLSTNTEAYLQRVQLKWNMRDSTARSALRALQEGKKIKLEYEAPWFWLVGISGAARPAEAPKPKQRKTRIDLSPSTEAESKASYDLSAQQDEELAPPKLTRQSNEPNLDDPIVARAMQNSPTSKVSDEQLEQHSELSEQAAAFMASQETAEDN